MPYHGDVERAYALNETTVKYEEAVFSPNPIGRVTSGATYTAYDRASHFRSHFQQLPIRQSHGGPRLDSRSMGLAILSALVRNVV